jgi:hypothetical protein
MSKKRKPAFRRTIIDEEEFEAITAAGYANCLRDMITNLKMIVKVVEEQELDMEVEILKLIDTAEETLAEDNTITH